MTKTIFAHLNEEDQVTSSRDEEHNVCWLVLGDDLKIAIDSSEKRDEIIKHLTFMEFENEND